MATKGNAVLFICTDIPEALEQGFNDWYTHEHLPERANGIPGFNRGRRFEALYDTPRYLAFYETDGPDVLQSEPYLALVRNFDPRSREYVPNFQRVSRTTLSVTTSAGIGEGGVIGIWALRPQSEREADLRDYLRRIVDTRALEASGAVAAHFWEKDDATLSASRGTHIRKGDRELSWIVAIEATHERVIRSLRCRLLSPDALSEAGMVEEEMFGAFRLLYSITQGG